MSHENEREITPEELEAEEAAELPAREAMSLITGLGPSLGGNPIDLLGGTGGSGGASPSGTLPASSANPLSTFQGTAYPPD